MFFYKSHVVTLHNRIVTIIAMIDYQICKQAVSKTELIEFSS